MTLQIQDPFSPNSVFLLEAFLEACRDSTFGAGAFAFVSAAGVQLLTDDDIFKEFIENHEFHLIVGVDSITNIAAVEALDEATKSLDGLHVQAFLHDRSGAIFHPKVCWFRTTAGITLITGSGNLTTGGLRGNWEAFSVTSLDRASADELEASWSAWLNEVTQYLRPVDDPDVISRVEKNIRVIGDGRAKAPQVASTTVELEREAEAFKPQPSDQALIAEIPRAGNRWNQANFDIHTFTTFFGATPGGHQRIVLYHVDSDGNLGRAESRPSVSVRSKNYRFELEAAAGLAYPAAGRPIGVFVRVSSRTFRYRLLLPQDPDHQIVSDFLTRHYHGRADRMRRVVVDIQLLKDHWAESPLWKTDQNE